MKKFEIGRSYSNTSKGNDYYFEVRVLARTEKTITIKDPMEGTVLRRITVYEGEETIYPHGKFSQAPTIRAGREVPSAPPDEPFRKCQVPADSLEDFFRRYTRPDRFDKRGKEYTDAVIQTGKEEIEKYGCALISHHNSVTGEMVSYYPQGGTL